MAMTQTVPPQLLAEMRRRRASIIQKSPIMLRWYSGLTAEGQNQLMNVLSPSEFATVVSRIGARVRSWSPQQLAMAAAMPQNEFCQMMSRIAQTGEPIDPTPAMALHGRPTPI